MTTQDGLDGLAGEWDDLLRATDRPSPFLLHAWLSEWWREYGGGAELRVHTVRRGDRLVAALPLAVRRRRGLRVAELVGTPTDFADVLVAPGEDEAAAEVVRHLGEDGVDYVHLRGITTQSRLARAPGLASMLRLEAPTLDLAPGWDAVYNAKTSSKKRNLHRRRRKQLAAEGEVTTRVLRSAEELDAVLDETFRLHELRWEGRYDGSGYSTPEGRRFHRAAIRRLAEIDVPRIVLLELDGKPIAFHYYFALGGRMYVHRLAFEPEYGRFSVGLLNTLDAIEAASAEGLTAVEWMGGPDRYKLEFSDGVVPMAEAIGLAATPQGRAAAAAARWSLELRLRLKRSDRAREAYRRVRDVATRTVRAE